MQTFGPAPAGLAQPRPALQLPLAQQTWPDAPQGSQVVAPPPSPPAWHDNPVPHDSPPLPPPQQASPRAPQAMHIPIAQPAPEAVQVVPPPPAPPSTAVAPPQHVCPTAPQLAPAAF
jgi:hypothetical protein